MRLFISLAFLLASFGLWAQGAPALKVSVGDKLSITVIGFKEFTGEFEVASDGTISGAGIGVVKVEGKSVEEVTALVKEKLKATLLDPQVFVGMMTEKLKVVYVVGLPPEPTSPAVAAKQTVALPAGQVPLTSSTTVRSLLAGAQLGDRADRLEAVVVRAGETLHQIDLFKLLHDDPAQFDGPLQANDILIIRPKAAVKVWFVGGFLQPGDHLVPEGLTLDQAIGFVGGYDSAALSGTSGETRSAFLGRARLELRRGDQVQMLHATAGSPDLQARVEPGDTITLVLPRAVNVTVGGYVKNSGEFTVDSGVGALAAVAKAGGPDLKGGLGQVILFRGADMFHLDLAPNQSGSADQMPLESGDIIYVSENKRYVQVVGSVKTAGSVYLPEDKRPFYASDALAGAGGLTPDGSLLRAVLLHPDGTGKYQKTQFNLDKFLKDGDKSQNPLVQPGDVLYFGTPKGISTGGIAQAITTAAVLGSFGVRF